MSMESMQDTVDTLQLLKQELEKLLGKQRLEEFFSKGEDKDIYEDELESK